MEASFCGSDIGLDKGFYYTAQHLENMGQLFGKALYDYFYVETPSSSENPIAAAAEPKTSITSSQSSLKSTNPLVKNIFTKIQQEISSGNPDFQETYGSSDSDTSSDEEGLRIVSKHRRKRRAKSHSSKTNPKLPISSIPLNIPEPESQDKLQRRNSAPLKSKFKPRPSQPIPKTQLFSTETVYFNFLKSKERQTRPDVDIALKSLQVISRLMIIDYKFKA